MLIIVNPHKKEVKPFIANNSPHVQKQNNQIQVAFHQHWPYLGGVSGKFDCIYTYYI